MCVLFRVEKLALRSDKERKKERKNEKEKEQLSRLAKLTSASAGPSSRGG